MDKLGGRGCTQNDSIRLTTPLGPWSACGQRQGTSDVHNVQELEVHASLVLAERPQLVPGLRGKQPQEDHDALVVLWGKDGHPKQK